MSAEATTEILAPKKRRIKKGKATARQGAKLAGKPKLVPSVETSSAKPNYIRFTTENIKWLAQKQQESEQPITKLVNSAIDAARTGGKFKIEKFEPKYVREAQAMLERRRARMKSKT